MKHCIITILMSALIAVVYADNASKGSQPIRIEWSQPEKWTANNIEQEVLAFEGAMYPTADLMPHLEIDGQYVEGYDCEAIIENPIYIPLSDDELRIVAGTEIGESPLIQTFVTKNMDNQPIFRISILPFVRKDNQLFKLLSFSLSTKTTKAKQRTALATNSFASSSVLASGHFVKIRVAETGVYKLSYEELQQMGIDPENVRIFGYGGAILSQNFSDSKIDDLAEAAIWMQKGSDNVFNTGDFILFYAQGINKWTYENSLFVHKGNTYSQYGYYFVTSDAGIGKKITEAAPVVPSGTIYQVSDFTDYQLHEVEQYSLLSSGKEFYGEEFANVSPQNFSFHFPNIVTSSNIKARIDVAASASTLSNFNVKLNTSQSGSIVVLPKSGYNTYQVTTSALTFTPPSDSLNFSLTYSMPGTSAIGYLNYIEVNAKRLLKMAGTNMKFRNVDRVGTSSYNTYNLSNAGNSIVVWDITDLGNISKIQTSRNGQTISFSSSNQTLKQYLAIDTTASFPSPEIVGFIENQNLHALTNIDMVILTHPRFSAQAQQLADAHLLYGGLNVAVVTAEQVYNEFSSGTPDASAYRWLMQMIYDRETDRNRALYLLLFGRGSFDNRGIIQGSSDNNLLLTYQADNSKNTVESYVTDDYFGLMKGCTDIQSNEISIALGRFPVTTVEEAQSVVDKSIAYMQNRIRDRWKNQLTFVADDGDGILHENDANIIAELTVANHPSYNINKIYLDAFQHEVTTSGRTYPTAKAKLLDQISAGTFYLNYMGHANSTGWTSEKVFTSTEIVGLKNEKHFLCFAGTCDFVHFDQGKISAGEYLLTNPIGGAIGVLSASRTVYASQNALLNRNFTAALFSKPNGQHYAIGEALVLAKNAVRGINRLSYVYFGDPALKLNYPTQYNVKTTQINGNTNLIGQDTLKSLSVNTIHGVIADDNGAVNTNFNGNLFINIYDKKRSITTLNNMGYSPAEGGIFTYEDRPDCLFAGQVKVVNGNFNFSFMLPKDMRYNFDTGRIVYHAESDSLTEAQGNFDNFIIGGCVDTIMTDNSGPLVDSIYLNVPSFVSGDRVNNSTPKFVATVYDESGINTSGNGIGHNISLVVDNKVEYTYNLNNYFLFDADSYTSGKVQFTIPELPDGRHILAFKVWDLLNFSTTKTLNFIVGNESGIGSSITNYPNPAVTHTVFDFTEEQLNDIQKVTLELFDLSGRKLWNYSQNSADAIFWNLETNYGGKLIPGMYLYRARLKTLSGASITKVNKLIVVKQ